jgi:cytochrome P450
VTETPARSYLGTPATAPGPDGPTMLRNTLLIRRDPLAFLAGMRERYGDVVQFPIPRPPTYLAASAPLAHRVLVANARNYGKDTIQYRSLALVTGMGLLSADDDQWRGQRPVVQPAFHRPALAQLGHIVADETDLVAREWSRLRDGAVVDVEAAMMDIALRVVGRTLFGDDLRGSSSDLARATVAALQVVIKRSRVPVSIPKFLPTPANRRLERSTAELEAAVAALVRRRGDSGSTAGGLLIDLLLASGLSPREVRDQIVTFLVAGHETAASGLTWALWLLADAPRWQDGVAAADDLAAAHAVADEALRLFPPAWVITRHSRGADLLGGHEVPAGALVIVSPYLIHRDPRWWDAPDEFDPSRFIGAKPQRMAAYLPFGAGMRLCIGRDFARWEMAVVLAELCRRFRFERLTGPQPTTLTEVTLRPSRGMLLRLRRN